LSKIIYYVSMCGIISLYSKGSNGIQDAQNLALGLQGLQHRGSDSVGAIISSPHHYGEAASSLGVTPEFLQQVGLMRALYRYQLEAWMGVDMRSFGQTRYTTDDSASNPHNRQPMRVGDKGRRLKLIFNGNSHNHLDIRRDHMDDQTAFRTFGDTETLAYFLLNRILKIIAGQSVANVRNAIRGAVREVLDRFQGGYSVIGDFGGEVFAFKDQFGIRPLAYGKKDKSIILSSEDHFFDAIWYEYVGEIPNGHLMFVWPSDELEGDYFPEPENLLIEEISPHPDSFEAVYLMKNWSRFYGGPDVSKIRVALWGYAASELKESLWWIHNFSRIISVPNGANSMKLWASQVLGIQDNNPNVLEKVADVRSFMASTDAERERLVRLKFRIREDSFTSSDCNDITIDDSIVRGTTMRVLIDMLREAWSHRMQVLSSCPIVKYGDKYGIAMSTNQLVARDKVSSEILTTEQIWNVLFADVSGRSKAQLFFPSVEWFKKVFVDQWVPHIHAAYFDGNFVAG
jgi:amidophosphoribosyltransferase